MTGRPMAGARSLWRANGMKEEQFGFSEAKNNE